MVRARVSSSCFAWTVVSHPPSPIYPHRDLIPLPVDLSCVLSFVLIIFFFFEATWTPLGHLRLFEFYALLYLRPLGFLQLIIKHAAEGNDEHLSRHYFFFFFFLSCEEDQLQCSRSRCPRVRCQNCDARCTMKYNKKILTSLIKNECFWCKWKHFAGGALFLSALNNSFMTGQCLWLITRVHLAAEDRFLPLSAPPVKWRKIKLGRWRADFQTWIFLLLSTHPWCILRIVLQFVWLCASAAQQPAPPSATACGNS